MLWLWCSIRLLFSDEEYKLWPHRVESSTDSDEEHKSQHSKEYMYVFSFVSWRQLKELWCVQLQPHTFMWWRGPFSMMHACGIQLTVSIPVSNQKNPTRSSNRVTYLWLVRASVWLARNSVCHLPFLYKVAFACNLTFYKICFTEMWTVLLNDTELAMARHAWHFVVSRNSTAFTCLHMWSCPVFSRSGINHSSNVATNCHRPLQRRPTHPLLLD